MKYAKALRPLAYGQKPPHYRTILDSDNCVTHNEETHAFDENMFDQYGSLWRHIGGQSVDYQLIAQWR